MSQAVKTQKVDKKWAHLSSFHACFLSYGPSNYGCGQFIIPIQYPEDTKILYCVLLPEGAEIRIFY